KINPLIKPFKPNTHLQKQQIPADQCRDDHLLFPFTIRPPPFILPQKLNSLISPLSLTTANLLLIFPLHLTPSTLSTQQQYPPVRLIASHNYVQQSAIPGL